MISWEQLSGWLFLEGFGIGLAITFGSLILYRGYVMFLLDVDILEGINYPISFRKKKDE